MTDKEKKQVELMARDAEAMDERNKELKTIDTTFGDNLPYDKTRLENECQFYLVQGTKAMLEMGKRLILIKEHEVHGDFTESLKTIGIEPRTAQKMMKATAKFKDKNESGSLLSISKLYTLMSESDEDLQELEEGGTIAGKSLDEIDRMTNAELKKALRDAKTDKAEEQEATEKLLSKKDATINKLDKKLSKRAIQLDEWDAMVSEMDITIAVQGGKVMQDLDNLDLLLDKMMHMEIPEDQREACEERMATNYIAVMKSATIKIDAMMSKTLGTIGAYEDRMIPLLDRHLKEQEEGQV